MQRTADLERFYELLAKLEARPNQGSLLGECAATTAMPRRGVYFFRERGEHRNDAPDAPRIVRVGTHAISGPSTTTLWSRLRAHRGPGHGGGNHRGSIFRLHIGAAILQRDGQSLDSWGAGQTVRKEVRLLDKDHERRVSKVIGAMSLLWVDVPDNLGRASARAIIERGSIALLSNKRRPFDVPSASWLGNSSPREMIKGSGLWNVRHVDERHDSEFLNVLATHIDAMPS